MSVPAVTQEAGALPYTLAQFFTDAQVQVQGLPPWVEEVALSFRPMEHQVKGVQLSCYYPRSGIFSETGTGKATIGQAWLVYWAAQGNKCLALMPPKLCLQFYRSFHSTFRGIDRHLRIVLFRGTPKQRDAMIEAWDAAGKDPEIVILSYDQFRGTKAKRQERLIPPGTGDWFRRRGYAVLFCDESTVIKKPGSGIYKAVKRFAHKEKEVAITLHTGTPAENNLTDLYAPISLITPGVYRSYSHFAYEHVISDNYAGFQRIHGFKNQMVLRERLYAQAMRVRKKDVLDLPPRVVSEVPIELEGAHQRLYDKLVDERILELEDGSVIDAVQAQSLRQKTQRLIATPEHFGAAPGMHNALWETVETLLESIDVEDHKVMLVCWFRESVEAAAQRFAHLDPALIYGGTTNSDKEVDKFLSTDACRMMILNYKSGGFGLNLQSACHYAIFAEGTTVPGWWTQANDRIFRAGQTEAVTVYLLTVLNTVSTAIRNRMLGKIRDNAKVVERAELIAELRGQQALID